jgi:tetratricopeptide (TPR) repeat protein
LCTDIVRALSGSRVDAVFESVGELDLKGLSEPVAASRVTWTVDVDAAVALPARLAASVTDRFVGRSVEQERITTAWKQTTSEEQCRVVLVSGEPGIGKTSLTARLGAGVQAEGAVVVYGRCDEDLGIPYQPWIEALTQLVAAVSDEVVQDHVIDRGAHLGRLVPTVARRAGVEVPTGDGGDSERFVLLGCVVDLLERASSDTPLLVVVDDLHWADRQSVQVLKHVATSAVQAPVMIVGTFRDTDVVDGDPMSELLAAFHRVDTVERIALRGLGDTDLLELLEHTAGHTMDDAGIALRDAVLAETDGNPFFVNEVLRHLAETGAIYQNDDGRWVGDDDIRAVGLPVSVTEVVGRRVAALGADTHQLLTVASVIGRDFDIATLAAAAGVDELDAIDRCDHAVSAAVLQPTAVVDRYTFTHALIERTLYDSMSPSRRARTHRTIAETIEALHGDDRARAGELAHHWTEAVQPADTVKALHYAQLAGNRALDQLAPDNALHWYSHALELADKTDTPPRQHVEILIGLGTAQRQTGRPEHRQTLLDAAQLADEMHAVDLLVRAVVANSRGWHSSAGTVDEDRVRMVERALQLFQDPSDASRAQLLALAAAEQVWGLPLDRRLALSEEAIATARRSGQDSVLVDALCKSSQALAAPSTLERRRTWVNEACELADAAGDLAAQYIAHDSARCVAIESGDLGKLRLHHAAAGEIAAILPHAALRWNQAFHEVWIAVLRGDLTDAAGLLDRSLEIGMAAEEADAFSIYTAQLVNIYNHQGRMHELVEALQVAIDDTPGLQVYRAVVAQAHAHGGANDAAMEILDEALVTGIALGDDQAWSTAITSWADAAVRVGHSGAARHLRRLMVPYSMRVTTTWVTVNAALAHYLGMVDHLLGDLDAADEWYQQAIAIHEALESPPLLSATQARWALLLLDRNRDDDRERAHTLAELALDTAAAGGYGLVRRDAEDALVKLET